VVSFTFWPFTPRERAPDIHWIGGWVGAKKLFFLISFADILQLLNWSMDLSLEVSRIVFFWLI
jgi:hypothetical protein